MSEFLSKASCTLLLTVVCLALVSLVSFLSLAAVVVVFEFFFGQQRAVTRFPFRAVAYFAISIYQFWTLRTFGCHPFVHRDQH